MGFARVDELTDFPDNDPTTPEPTTVSFPDNDPTTPEPTDGNDGVYTPEPTPTPIDDSNDPTTDPTAFEMVTTEAATMAPTDLNPETPEPTDGNDSTTPEPTDGNDSSPTGPSPDAISNIYIEIVTGTMSRGLAWPVPYAGSEDAFIAYHNICVEEDFRAETSQICDNEAAIVLEDGGLTAIYELDGEFFKLQPNTDYRFSLTAVNQYLQTSTTDGVFDTYDVWS